MPSSSQPRPRRKSASAVSTQPERSGRSPAEATFDPELRRLAVVVVLGGIMTILDTTIVTVAINTLGRAFHTSLSTIQWVLTAYTLALAMTIPLTGWAVRRFGGKTMWITSLMLFIVGSVLCGAAWSVSSLIVFRILQAIGGGMLLLAEAGNGHGVTDPRVYGWRMPSATASGGRWASPPSRSSRSRCCRAAGTPSQ
jgi:MFS family permease